MAKFRSEFCRFLFGKKRAIHSTLRVKNRDNKKDSKQHVRKTIERIPII